MLIAADDDAKYVVILRPLQGHGGEQPIVHEPAVTGGCGDASRYSPTDDLIDEEPIWETEIADELLDMISRKGDTSVALRIEDSREDAGNLERELMFGKITCTHTNRVRKAGELPRPVGVYG